jgi:hypothetical protein
MDIPFLLQCRNWMIAASRCRPTANWRAFRRVGLATARLGVADSRRRVSVAGRYAALAANGAPLLKQVSDGTEGAARRFVTTNGGGAYSVDMLVDG